MTKTYQVIEIEKPRSAYHKATEEVWLETADLKEAKEYAIARNERLGYSNPLHAFIIRDTDGEAH